MRAARLLLALSAAIFAFGAAMHALAYRATASAQIENANVPAFLGRELKGLWLTDSTTLAAMALLCAFVAARPDAASGYFVMLLSLVPAATAAVLYVFLGGFYAAHMLMAASAMVFVAGLLLPSRNPNVRT